MNIGDGSGSTVYPIGGSVSAVVDGAAVVGTFTADSGTWQGSADLGGAFFDDDAKTLAGALAGSLNGGGGNHAFYGTVDLDKVP